MPLVHLRPTDCPLPTDRLGRVPGMAVYKDRSIPLDTSVEARRRQVSAWIAMGPEGRVRLAAAMSDDIRRVAAEGDAARTSRSDTRGERPR